MDTTTEALRAVGALPIPVFLCAQGAALALALALFARRLRRGGGVRSRSAVIAAGGGAVFGAALLGIALRMPRAFLGHGDEVFAPGLLMAYGALLGAPLAVAATSWDPAERVRRLAALAPSLGVLVSVGRLGCFFAGCCFGRPSGAPWAVAYPEGTPAFVHHATAGTLEPGAHATVHLHPTSLYEVLLGAVMIFAPLTPFDKRDLSIDWKALDREIVARQLVVQDLDRDLSLDRLVHADVDRPHAALADDADERVLIGKDAAEHRVFGIAREDLGVHQDMSVVHRAPRAGLHAGGCVATGWTY